MELKVLYLITFSTIASGKIFNEVTRTQEEKEVKLTQCGESLYSEKDIQLLINYVADSLPIDKIINDTIQSEVVPVRNKHLLYIENFNKWFQDRPEHLKHILHDISETREELEADVFEFKDTMRAYPELVKIYQEKVEKTKVILKKLDHHKQLCQLNCESEEVISRAAQTTPNYYCGSIADVHNTITQQLEEFAHKFSLELRQQMIEADRVYDNKVQDFINSLKDTALKEFGRTMYDILNLQDEYHHFISELQGIQDNSWLLVLKGLNFEIDSIVMKLENVVDVFGAYCKSCDPRNINHVLIEDRQQFNGNERESVLDLLINSKIMEIYNNTEKELFNIFQELNEKLDNINLDSLYISNLKPIQHEITELIEVEFEAFNNLNTNLKTDLELIKKLIVNTKELIDAILEQYRAVVTVVNKISYLDDTDYNLL